MQRAPQPRTRVIGSARRFGASAERRNEFQSVVRAAAGDEWLCNLAAALLRLCAIRLQTRDAVRMHPAPCRMQPAPRRCPRARMRAEA
eukprot:5862516-Prymnesium_polylepis.1